jgi:hypothetical protein
VCDPTLGPNFLKETYIHYDMNSELEMFMKKLQMLAYSYVFLDQKLAWLKQWNKSNVLKEVKKFPK